MYEKYLCISSTMKGCRHFSKSHEKRETFVSMLMGRYIMVQKGVVAKLLFKCGCPLSVTDFIWSELSAVIKLIHSMEHQH